MSENEVNLAGEAHLNSLRKYFTRLSALVEEMQTFAKLTIADFGPDEQTRCKNLVNSATILQSLVGKVTDISEPAFEKLNMSQKVQLTELMNRLVECNMDVVGLVMVLNTAIDFLENTELVFAPAQGSGSV